MPAIKRFAAENKARLSAGASLLFGLAATIVLLFFVDLDQIVAQLRQADWRYLLAACASLTIGYLVYALRWHLLLAHRPGFSETFHASNLGNLLNMLLPLRPGEATRIVAITRSGAARTGEAASSIIIERLLENIVRIAAVCGALLFGLGLEFSGATLLGLILFLLASLLVLLWAVRRQKTILKRLPPLLGRLPYLSEEGTRSTLSELFEALQHTASPRSLATGLFTSFLAWAFFFGYHYLVLLALDLSFTHEQMLLLTFGSLAMVPPSAPTLPGIFHAQIVIPFAALGLASSDLTAYSIVLFAFETLWIVAFGALALVRSGTVYGSLFTRKRLIPLPIKVSITSSD
jgi:hypothetical protein